MYNLKHTYKLFFSAINTAVCIWVKTHAEKYGWMFKAKILKFSSIVAILKNF